MSKKTKKQPKKNSKIKSAPAPKAARAKSKKANAKTLKTLPIAGSKETEVPTSDAPAEQPAQHSSDPRLPAPGTLLQKRDRHGAVRCECTVEEGGIRYEGTIYKSLSAAAMAAAKDLQLTNKTQNGFVFWGLSKPPRHTSDPLASLERVWERYHGNIETFLRGGLKDEIRGQVVATIRKHAKAIESLVEKVA